MAKAHTVGPSTASKVLVVLLIIVGVAVVVSFGARTLGMRPFNEQRTIDHNTYQAVHLTNGQVYFGTIKRITPDSIFLNNVYYVDDESADLSLKKATLIKHQTQPYGPNGSMIINRNQVLFWENLEDTGLVTTTIMNNSGQR